jgi:LytS/YehU family sensor histidine kinase
MLYVAAFATGSLHLTGPDLQMLIHDPFTRTYWAAVTITYGAPYFFGLFLIVSATLLVRLQNEMRMRSELDKQYFETRLETLRGQLGPHFLSNALNTALAFVRHDPDKAEQAITGLNHLLRAGFEITPKHIVSLRKELSYVNHYLTIMKLRFEDMLDIAISVPDEILDCLIPDFLLVTLLENAFKHGGPSSSGRMTIDLTITSGSQDLLIRIENSLALEGSSSKMGWGVGLRNTRDRLSVLYGDDYHMDGGLSRPNHWQVKIRLPLIPGEP